jgi:hypothetical protein
VIARGLVGVQLLVLLQISFVAAFLPKRIAGAARQEQPGLTAGIVACILVIFARQV